MKNIPAKHSRKKRVRPPERQQPVIPEKTDLFVYGTLMDDNHVELLLNRRVESEGRAELYNYMKVAPEWSFPFIVKHPGSKIVGRLLKGLSKEELERIDSFEVEGSLYFRRPVTVKIGEVKHKCQTYIGNISAIYQTFGDETNFEDRYSLYIEKKIDSIIDEMPKDRPDITRRVLRELMSSEADSIVQSHFDGNYICNYIMIQAFEDARPPSLKVLLENEELLPYAGNYIRLACQHIVFNQFVERIRRDFPDSVRVSEQYFRHGIAILFGFKFYNKCRDTINKLFAEHGLDRVVEGRSYRDYATIAIEIVDIVYKRELMLDIVDCVENNWYSTPTPIGAELEFSHLGHKAVNAEPGDDKIFDGFFWFSDFDMIRRTWRLGGHVDSHRNITAGQKRHRGFFEYALGRYQIVGDLSRPLFDCPWGLSEVINEAVSFLDIPPHSLHVSMELKGKHSHITDQPHEEEDLVCLLLLGGDVRPDSDGKLREFRIYKNELDTNFRGSLNFSDRKHHFSKPEQDVCEASDTMEYKFMRLHNYRKDYEKLIIALKGYQFETHSRPVSIQKRGGDEFPEQNFMRKWAEFPEPVDEYAISKFLHKIEKGLLEENNACKLDRRKSGVILALEKELREKNAMISQYHYKMNA